MAWLFGALAAWLMRYSLPVPWLVAWVVVLAAINLIRAIVATAFVRRGPRLDGNWRRWEILGHALGGLWWGVTCASAIIYAPSDYALAVFAIFAILASFQSASPVNYFPAFTTSMAAAIVPMISAALFERDELMRFMIPLGGIFLFSTVLIGRNRSRFMIEAITKREENVRLLRDLEAQKDALDKANFAKTRFLAAASHDLRQPMQAVVLLVESLQERVKEPEVRRIVASIRTSVAAMADLLNGILDISKFDAGTVKPQRSHFRIAPLLNRLSADFAQSAAQKSLRLKVRASEAVVESDPVLLYRILSNIVNNAVRYTSEGGVLVGCRRRSGQFLIQVWDTGAGIPEDQIGEIFREFHQLGNPQRDREQGLGLGLAIVDRTARLLETEVRVRSRVGKGSVFSIEVPVGDPEAIQAIAKPVVSSLEGCSVLVVDDEPEIRAAITLLLEGWGCKVCSAGSGAEALTALTQFEPDVIVADYRLPGAQNGIEVIQAVVARHPGIGGVLTSGDIAPEVLREAEASGYTLLHKPLRPARLRALIGNLWRARAAQKETA